LKIEVLKFVLAKIFLRSKKNYSRYIAVIPKNYRRIALHAIENCKEPIVFMDGYRIEDFSENGQLVQKRMRVRIRVWISGGIRTK